MKRDLYELRKKLMNRKLKYFNDGEFDKVYKIDAQINTIENQINLEIEKIEDEAIFGEVAE